MMSRMISHIVPHVRKLPGVPVAVLVIPNDGPMTCAVADVSLAPVRSCRFSAIEVKFRERIVLVASAYRQQTKHLVIFPSVLLAQVHAVAHPSASTRSLTLKPE